MAKPAPPNDADGLTEYDAFRDLTARLVKVPKRELDEAREREQAQKG